MAELIQRLADESQLTKIATIESKQASAHLDYEKKLRELTELTESVAQAAELQLKEQLYDSSQEVSTALEQQSSAVRCRDHFLLQLWSF